MALMNRDGESTAWSADQALLQANFRAAVELHDQEWFTTIPEADKSDVYARESATEASDVFVDRLPEEIAAYFGLTYHDLRDRAFEGLTADIGPGKSELLASLFTGKNQLVAVDLEPRHVRHQAAMGITALQGDGCALPCPPFEDDSVRTLFAVFSLPYWSPTKAKAAAFCDELVRVLQPGGAGTAFVGSLIPHGLDQEWEQGVQARSQLADADTTTIRPWGGAADRALSSLVLASYGRRLLEYIDAGVVAAHWTRLSDGTPEPSTAWYVPNFARITKL
ncbi:MAG TPA: class I SAM-dependent methyltransferase [Bacillota bacterium]|nr:class I SAM-dependent methyltransferase [Bacillota bacterium]